MTVPANGACSVQVVRSAMVESLESRTLLTGVPVLKLTPPPVKAYPLPSQIVGRVLIVEGSRRPDAISLSVTDDGTILADVNGDQTEYDPSKFKSILINGGRGDDVISVGSSRREIFAPVVAFGGLGHDTIGGGSGDDELHGGSGWDVIYGNAGDDIILGESQTDTLRGGDGDDTIFGAGGNDLIAGDEGDDALFGGADADRFVIEMGEPRTQVGDPGKGDVVYENDGTIFSKSVI